VSVKNVACHISKQKMQESRLIEVIPLVPTLAILGQYPILSHPESPQGTLLGVGAVTEGLTVGTA